MKIFLILLFLIYFMISASNCSLAQKSPVLEQSNEVKVGNLKDQGMVFYKEGKYTEALNCFKRIDANSLNDEILLLTANCYDSLNNTTKASEFLIKAIEYNPGNPSSYYNLGLLHYKNNNINQAIDNFKKSIKFNTSFAAAYYNLGVCYYSIHDFKKAKDSFSSAINLDPENANTCYNLVATFNSLNDKKMAEKYLDIYSKMSKKEQNKDIISTETLKNNLKSEQAVSLPNKNKRTSDKKQNSFWQNLNFIVPFKK